MSASTDRLKHPIPISEIGADIVRSKQEAKRVYIVQEICRRCRTELLFSACQFSDGECILETIGNRQVRR